ncbi:MAG: hypothetical protein AAF694_14640 [Bacteroidota bacterium]
MDSAFTPKVFELLDSMDSGEHRSFRPWLAYRHPRDDEQVFVNLYLAAKEKRKRSRDFIWKSVWPNEAFDERKLARHLNKLKEDAEDFFVSNTLLDSSRWREVFLFRVHNERNLSEAMRFSQKAFEKRAKLEDGTKAEDFITSFLIEKEIQNHLIKIDQKKEKRREAELLSYFLKWVIVEKLKLACMTIITNRTQKQQISQPEVREELNLLQEYPNWTENSLIALWYTLYLLLSSGENTNFLEAFELLKDRRTKISRDDLVNLFFLLVNHKIYLAMQPNTPSKDLYEELLPIYQWGIDHELFYVDGYLRSRQFKNLYRLPMILGKPKLAETYIQTLSAKLLPEEREHAISLAEAHLMFARGDFNKVVKQIGQTKIVSIHSRISQRFLLIFSQYENSSSLQERQRLIPSILSLRQFIHDQKNLSDAHKDFHKARTKQIHSLIKSTSIDQLESLKHSCTLRKEFPERNWLIEKTEEKIHYIQKFGKNGKIMLNEF